jgi:hypothetical protein
LLIFIYNKKGKIMTNQEILHNAKYQLSLLIKTLEEAMTLPQDEMENLSLNFMKKKLEKEHQGLNAEVYDLEYQLYRLKNRGK